MNLGGALQTVGDIYDGINAVRNGESMKSHVDNAINRLELLEISGSLARLVNSMSVNPIIITTEEARRSPAYNDAIKVQIDIFCAFYLSAFKLLTDVYGIGAKMAIGALNTGVQSVYGKFLAGESYIENLFSSSPIKISSEASIKLKNKTNIVSIKDGETKKTLTEGNYDILTEVNKIKDSVVEKVQYRQLELVIDITTGRTVNREFEKKEKVWDRDPDGRLIIDKDGNAKSTDEINSLKLDEEYSKIKKIVIPILVKTSVIETDLKNISALIRPFDSEKSFINRWREWRSGGISFLDFLFCGDLIKEYRKDKFKDKEDLLSIINRRTATSTIKSMKMINGKMSGLAGFEDKYNMFLIGKEDLRTLSALTKQDLTRAAGKQKFLDQAHGLLYGVLDDDYERLSIFIDDFQQETKTSYKAISGKKDGQIDMTELMKALMMGRPMAF